MLLYIPPASIQSVSELGAGWLQGWLDVWLADWELTHTHVNGGQDCMVVDPRV